MPAPRPRSRWLSVLAGVWTALIVIALVIPSSPVEMRSVGLDKVAHFVLFFGFGWLWMQARPGARLAIAAGGFVLAAASEPIQQLLPWERNAEVLDFVADVLGLAAGIALGIWQKRRAGARAAPEAAEG